MPYTPERRLAPSTMAAIARAGWTAEPSLAKIMGRTWAILRRPHPSGSLTRLMADVTGVQRHELKLDLPRWSAHSDASGQAVDFPAFASAISKELDRLGIRHSGWPTMGVDGTQLTDHVMFEVKAADNGASADVLASVSCSLDPVDAAGVVATALRRAWRDVHDFNELQAGGPVVERSAVVAACAVAQDVGHAVGMLSVRPPIRVITWFTLSADRPHAPRVSFATLPSERRLDGRIPRTPCENGSRMVRTERCVTARTVNGHFRCNGNSVAPVNAEGIPDTTAVSLACRPLEEALDHPAVRGSGLVIERAWMSPGRKRKFLRMKVRSDPLSFTDAKTLASVLVRQVEEHLTATEGLPIVLRWPNEDDAPPAPAPDPSDR